MNKLIEDWIVNEILDTLRQARISLLGITALDSPLELQRKTKENSTAITRRIEKALDLIDPSKLPIDWQKVAEGFTKDQPLGQDNNGNLIYPQEQPVDLEKEIENYLNNFETEKATTGEIRDIARHFANLGRKIERTRLGAVLKEKTLDAKAHPDDDELWVDLQGQGLKDGDSVKVLIIKEKNNG